MCGMQIVHVATDAVPSERDYTNLNYLDEGYFKLYPIANASVEETFTDEMPASWSNNCWGSNTTTFTYLRKGHNGKHSLKIEVSDYMDGDAKWIFRPLELSPGDYLFRDFYKSDVETNYIAHRTAVERGFNSYDNFDVSRLKSMSVMVCTTAQDIEKWVRKAKEENLWLILLYHRVTDDPNEYDTTPKEFTKHLQIIKDSGLPVVTFS